ncbi:uncharacterized protein CANTADRAFT_5934 [Suhomyces tanzawaensis NRRL Y-17324]|uniref:Uncharacterized protein n=1 Tax=Suhomyces tanzawaensis NRRL Y-17324 TaxID=984487 RepID=A0A1E4SLA8_9ASCO|nr:uncharacterized protein CANTADRAFT_5934 [Suhomyces tanzawaensis NRRL Y-17324]ODV80286.1 hypothetical protein CANTADRAFT_5934 [Suhomyces tanzawaensis NRRL Y-17324]
MSTHKIPYEGIRPNIYQRSNYDFDSQYTGPDDGGMNIMALLEQDRNFEMEIRPRTESLQKLVGTEFDLTIRERLVILCGLSNLRVSFEDAIPGSQIVYESSRLRQMGQTIIKLHLSLQTVFTDESFLSSSGEEVEQDVDFFEKAEEFMIIEFMKKNLVYNNVVPFQGAMRHGPIHSQQKYTDRKKRIRDKTSIGSFYTMVGLLHVKYLDRVLESVIINKIINGSSGLVNIRVEAETR